MTTPPNPAKLILVVEDNTQVRTAIALALKMEKYAVAEAGDGREALTILKNSQVDLILSDINMPNMNGIELFDTVRRNPSSAPIPFIFLTANDTSQDIQTGRETGAEDYLTKPIDTPNLLRIIAARLLRAADVRAAFMDQAFLETVKVLANTVESRDPYTFGHVERVTRYALWLAAALNWSPASLRTLEYGARLHDIGKIIVPDHVLKKAGPLTPDEWRLMKQHPAEGAKIIQGISLLKSAIPYVLYHHEKWDGTGYPEGLRGADIPVEGRLLSVADVFDALTSERPYRPALSAQDGADFIARNAGIHFDPDFAPAFVTVIHDKIIPQMQEKAAE
jgi:putative two-component system response regulator